MKPNYCNPSAKKVVNPIPDPCAFWEVPVNDLSEITNPSRDYAYILPDNSVWVLNFDETGFVQLSGGGSGGQPTLIKNEDGMLTITGSGTYDVAANLSQSFIEKINQKDYVKALDLDPSVVDTLWITGAGVAFNFADASWEESDWTPIESVDRLSTGMLVFISTNEQQPRMYLAAIEFIGDDGIFFLILSTNNIDDNNPTWYNTYSSMKIESQLSLKQDKLKAGEYITITDNTITADGISHALPIIREQGWHLNTFTLALEGDTRELFDVKHEDEASEGEFVRANNATYYTIAVKAVTSIKVFKKGGINARWEYYLKQDSPDWNNAEPLTAGYIQNKPDVVTKQALLGNSITLVDTSDLKGKVTGSDIENPNRMTRTAYPNLLAPSSITIENNQTQYDAVKNLDGNVYTQSSAADSNIFQVMFSWNVIEILERQYPAIFQGAATLAEKVAFAKKEIKSLVPSVFGFGSGVEGNKLSAAVYFNNAWSGTSTNLTTQIKKISWNYNTEYAISNLIHPDGFVYVIAYAPASDGTIASIVNIDYASIELTTSISTTDIYATKSDTYTKSEADEKFLQPATTLQSGIVKLANTTTSTSVTEAATANSVRVVAETLFSKANVSQAQMIKITADDGRPISTLTTGSILDVAKTAAGLRSYVSTNTVSDHPPTSQAFRFMVQMTSSTYGNVIGVDDGNQMFYRVIVDGNWKGGWQKVAAEPEISQLSDFKGKLVGDLTSNRNVLTVAYHANHTTSGYVEVEQSQIIAFAVENDDIATFSTSVSGTRCLLRQRYDAIDLYEKINEFYFSGLTTKEEKINKLRNENADMLEARVLGKANVAGANNAVLGIERGDNKSLQNIKANTSSVIAEIKTVANVKDSVDADGYINVVLYSNPATATESAEMSADYGSLTVRGTMKISDTYITKAEFYNQ
ncbi:hypothetical protein ACYSNR_00855 [Enterococcus sp. LJL128]